MNVGWAHLDAPADAWRGVAGHLPPFADREAVARLLGRPPDGLTVENVWFIPGRSLTVVYRAGGEDLVVAYGNPPTVRALRDDPALPALAGLFDTRRAAQRAGGPVEEVRILAYLPGERCAVRYRGPAVDVVAKVSRREDMAASDARMRALHALPGRAFLMPEPLGVDGEGVRLERAVPGERAEALLGRVAPERLLAAVEAAAAGIGAVPADGHPRNGVDEVLARMTRKTVPRVAVALPSLGPRLAAFLDRLARTAPPTAPARVIHGDLHTANVLFGSGLAPAFVDLDNLALGDPEYDLALFASRLVLLGLVAGIPVELPEGYGGDPARFRWYLAATLVGRQTKTCVRHLAPGMLGLCEALLARAAALVAA